MSFERTIMPDSLSIICSNPTEGFCPAQNSDISERFYRYMSEASAKAKTITEQCRKYSKVRLGAHRGQNTAKPAGSVRSVLYQKTGLSARMVSYLNSLNSTRRICRAARLRIVSLLGISRNCPAAIIYFGPIAVYHHVIYLSIQTLVVSLICYDFFFIFNENMLY